ncbi:carboxylesterase/lipase family protein [Umezawaea endophytica]|uniref:Carboxylesterase family protein n=1 Tax=Umezawaea endophytica TaxID=1654476 RepID=A0A9X2VHJ6_9PSEU|nr:carboxylesterase family protein [Umezawaea endophytica]MCS7476751.1 carboxylesterase family protein [Umezawaea endophytica]
MTSSTTARTSSGLLRGTREDGVDRYLGVPYAAAPVGELRFAEPAPAPAWDGVRDATAMGPTAPQTPYGPATAKFVANVIDPGDDYLNVNVWTPADARDRPVLVWVHGGSFAHGSNALDGYDGTAFARDGVVFVSVNYRLASEGFSVLDGAPLNLGLRDVAAALRWVRAEIAAFGGDPRTVTAFGESAGAGALGTLLASPGAAELFDRVILQSGAPGATEPKTAGRVTRKIARTLGIPATRAAFVGTEPVRLLEAEAAVTAGTTPITGGLGFGPAIGDDVVPAAPLEAILAGAGDTIPVVLGWNADEARLWLVPSGLVDRFSRVLFAAVRLRFRVGRRVLRAYRAAHPQAGRGELFGHLATDIVLRLPFHRVADARLERRAAPTYVYEFAWQSPVADLRAAHVMEIGFVFDRLRSPDWTALTGPDAPQRLADEVHAAWVRFASTGDPGWTAWSRERPVNVFDEPVSAVVDAPRDTELASWRKRSHD